MNQTIKKCCIFLAIGFSFFSFTQDTNAIKVTVSMDLSPIGLTCSSKSTEQQGQGNDKNYECDIGNGFSAVTGVFQGLLKYIAFIASIGAVLFIVINGILYSMAGLDEHLKSDAKHKIFMMLGGIILLLLSGVVLQLIAPWVYK